MMKVWHALREGLVFAILLVWYPCFVVTGLIWRLVKVLLFVAVIYGAIREIGTYLPSEWSENVLSFDGLWSSGIAVFDAATQAWAWIAIAFVFFQAWQGRRTIEQIAKHAGSVLTAIVALSNYLKIEVETDELKTMREKGGIALIAQALNNWLLSLLVGEVPDGRYFTKPVRGGDQIEYWEDLRAEVIRALERRT